MPFTKSSLLSILLLSFSFSAEVQYDTQSDISGFQFRVTGAEIQDVYGGAAEEAGFQVAFNPSTGMVVAFTLTGNPIPAGQGSLVTIDYEGDDSPCIEDLIVSDVFGGNMVTYLTGCLSFTDACNGVQGCNIADITYETFSNIYGFEFQVTGAELVDVYGGAAADAGFQIAFNPATGMVVAFSMQGTPIPPGNGTLVQIEYIGDPCLEDLIVAGDGAAGVETYVSGCTDIIEGCSSMDECGVCNGNGDSCADCSALSEWSCQSNAYCDWVSDTVSCSGLSSSQCNAASGCNWVSGGGGPYGGGSSYCSGGTGEINGQCFELDCEDLGQQECETDSECTWVSGGGGGYGGGDSSHCAEVEVPGCTDPYAENYEEGANTNDGSCEYGPLGTLSFHNYDYINKTVEVHLDCEFDVSDFVFTIDGLAISSFSGGTSEDAGFEIELQGNTIIGSSTSSDNIPPDSGMLMLLNFISNESEICFAESSITTYAGIVYEAVLGPCVVPGCIDSLGCNFNQDATDSDGTCFYPFCDGSCDSGAEIDECGICGGGGIPEWACDCDGNVLDCYGDCGGQMALDECGECGGDNTDCCPGDMNEDDTMDVLDIVEIVDALLNQPWPSYELFCSDFNDDGILNVLDLIVMVETILYGAPRLMSDVSYARIDIDSGQVRIESDGHVSGVQMILSHGEDFRINLTDAAAIAEYRTSGNITNVIIAGLETGNLFSVEGDFIIEHIIAGNGGGEISVGLPSELLVGKAFPNPFNPSTTIAFQLPGDADVSIDVYSIQGTNVATLADQSYEGGYHSVAWDASTFPSGLYFVKIVSGSYISTQKIMLLK